MIEIRSASKSLSGKRILNQLSFNIPDKTVTGFIGANGAGKTTLIKCLMGFMSLDSGEIIKPKQTIGYFSERPYFHDFLSAEKFLKFHWDLSEASGSFEQACDEVLRKVKLLEVKKDKLKTFSKGMLQRIGLAQALLTEPQWLILDEPMSGLDPEGRQMMKDLIRQESARGSSIFFSTHVLSDVEELCTHLIALDRGQCLFQGSVTEFMKQRKVENENLSRSR